MNADKELEKIYGLFSTGNDNVFRSKDGYVACAFWGGKPSYRKTFKTLNDAITYRDTDYEFRYYMYGEQTRQIPDNFITRSSHKTPVSDGNRKFAIMKPTYPAHVTCLCCGEPVPADRQGRYCSKNCGE